MMSKVIGITGGTGTLGSALVHQLLSSFLMAVDKIVIVSRDEQKQSNMMNELRAQYPQHHAKVRMVIGCVRDRARLTDAFYGCGTIIHTAALKRVDSVAYHPEEVLKTNVTGTQNVLGAAVEVGAKHVVVVSTDKAVQPTNVYGVSKSAAEFLTIHYNVYSAPRGTGCSVVRYGNVLGSRGSFLQSWKTSVHEGRPFHVTHRDMTRFILFPRDAVSLILHTVLDVMEGGEVFVPISPAVKLGDLVDSFCRVMVAQGYPPSQVSCQTVGIRPGGEKYHETLLTREESKRGVIRAMIDPMVGGLVKEYVTVYPELHPWRDQFPYQVTDPRADICHSSDREVIQPLSKDDLDRVLQDTYRYEV